MRNNSNMVKSHDKGQYPDGLRGKMYVRTGWIRYLSAGQVKHYLGDDLERVVRCIS